MNKIRSRVKDESLIRGLMLLILNALAASEWLDWFCILGKGQKKIISRNRKKKKTSPPLRDETLGDSGYLVGEGKSELFT